MSSPARAPKGAVRSRRSAVDVAVVATGDAASRAVLRALASASTRSASTRPALTLGTDRPVRAPIGSVRAIGLEPPGVDGVEFRRCDPADPALAQALRGADEIGRASCRERV